MEQFLNYYGFEAFVKDQSEFFKYITFTHIKEDYFLVIEKEATDKFHIHLTTYSTPKDIGIQKPSGLNTLIQNFELDNNDHRRLIQQYLDYN